MINPHELLENVLSEIEQNIKANPTADRLGKAFDLLL